MEITEEKLEMFVHELTNMNNANDEMLATLDDCRVNLVLLNSRIEILMDVLATIAKKAKPSPF